MPVNLPTPDISDLYPVEGVELGYAMAHIRKPNRKDLLIIRISQDASVSGIFTLNKFCAAPVQICTQHLSITNNNIRALIINTGNANAGTGETGLQHAKLTCEIVAKNLNIQASQVLPFSTGVILEPLPIDRILSNIPQAINNNASWLEAAQSIMTTDTIPKAYSKKIIINNEEIVITGIAKGAGMIKPNMATMLGFIATNANISQSILDILIKDIGDKSFNSITIDGDTSTNDSFIIIASNKCTQHNIDNINAIEYTEIKQALLDVAVKLAQAIVRDGEGATKFISIEVQNAQNKQDAKKIAYAIAHSPLVKTAFFASDPNLGRILAAIGYAGVGIQIEKINMWLNDVQVIQHGARYSQYTEQQGQQIMQNTEIYIRIDLDIGQENAIIWTCDLSHEYVSINADYRS